MSKKELFDHLKNKDDIKQYVSKINNNDLLEYLFILCEEDSSSIKYQSEKVIRYISINNPKILYPYFDRMLNFLNNQNKFLKLGFIISIPNLIKADLCNRWTAYKHKYYEILTSSDVMEFCNLVKCIPNILEYHMEDEATILPFLVDIDNHIFLNKNKESKECINIAKSIIIDTLYKIYKISDYKEEIKIFINNNLNNIKPQIKNKCNKFIKKYGEQNGIK